MARDKKGSTLVKNWLKYFILKDRNSKILALITIVAGVVWGFNDFTKTLGTIFAGLLIFTIIFSFFSYLIVGVTRQRALTKFYDSIYSSAGFPGPFSGRRELCQLPRPRGAESSYPIPHKIDVEWKGLKVSRVTIHTDGTTTLSRSTKEWRIAKQAVIDTFPLAGDRVYADLSEQRKGIITYNTTYDEDHLNGADEAVRQEFEEGLYTLVYDVLGSYNVPLPVIEIGPTFTSSASLLPEEFSIQTTNSPSSYERRDFENGMRTKYIDPETIWGFAWGHQDVRVHRILKGSDEEKQLIAYNTLNKLVSGALSRTYISTDKEDYRFSPEMLTLDRGGRSIRQFSVEFMDVDLSDPEKLENFETMVRRGLAQLFPEMDWSFAWDISMFGKTLTVKAAY